MERYFYCVRQEFGRCGGGECVCLCWCSPPGPGPKDQLTTPPEPHPVVCTEVVLVVWVAVGGGWQVMSGCSMEEMDFENSMFSWIHDN